MSAEPKTQLTVVTVNESEANVNASQSEMADMSKFQLQLIINRLKVRDTILTSMSQALLHMQSADCNEKQKKRLYAPHQDASRNGGFGVAK